MRLIIYWISAASRWISSVKASVSALWKNGISYKSNPQQRDCETQERKQSLTDELKTKTEKKIERKSATKQLTNSKEPWKKHIYVGQLVIFL